MPCAIADIIAPASVHLGGDRSTAGGREEGRDAANGKQTCFWVWKYEDEATTTTNKQQPCWPEGGVQAGLRDLGDGRRLVQVQPPLSPLCPNSRS